MCDPEQLHYDHDQAEVEANLWLGTECWMQVTWCDCHTGWVLVPRDDIGGLDRLHETG